jgi:hypothetical protein
LIKSRLESLFGKAAFGSLSSVLPISCFPL